MSEKDRGMGKKEAEKPEYMKVGDLATWLNLSLPHVYRLVAEEEAIKTFRFGKAIRVSRASVESFLARQREDDLEEKAARRLPFLE